MSLGKYKSVCTVWVCVCVCVCVMDSPSLLGKCLSSPASAPEPLCTKQRSPNTKDQSRLVWLLWALFFPPTNMIIKGGKRREKFEHELTSV